MIEKENYELFMAQLYETNATLDFYCDFTKIQRNVADIAISLNTLNYLIGKDDIAGAVEQYKTIPRSRDKEFSGLCFWC